MCFCLFLLISLEGYVLCGYFDTFLQFSGQTERTTLERIQSPPLRSQLQHNLAFVVTTKRVKEVKTPEEFKK